MIGVQAGNLFVNAQRLAFAVKTGHRGLQRQFLDLFGTLRPAARQLEMGVDQRPGFQRLVQVKLSNRLPQLRDTLLQPIDLVDVVLRDPTRRNDRRQDGVGRIPIADNLPPTNDSHSNPKEIFANMRDFLR